MPAANIIAIHEGVENSGSSRSCPRRIWPNFEMATPRMKKTNTVPIRTNSQPALPTTPSSAADTKPEKFPGASRPHRTTASRRTPAGAATFQSSGASSSFAGGAGMPSTVMGAMSSAASSSVTVTVRASPRSGAVVASSRSGAVVASSLPCFCSSGLLLVMLARIPCEVKGIQARDLRKSGFAQPEARSAAARARDTARSAHRRSRNGHETITISTSPSFFAC